ncbi:MAG: hypothetical protein ACI395_09695 [Candidatus Cryptobacteroides sp.]
MKTNFFKWAVCSVVALSALVSCENKENQEVQFPDSLGTITVEPGQQVELTFKALFDWELVIEGDDASTDWFWFNEGSQPVLKTSGQKTESVTAILNVSEEVEYETTRTCNVYIYMTGKPMLFATIVRPASEPVFNLFSAITDEYGYVYSDGGDLEFVYHEGALTAEETTSLVWVPESGSWGMRFHANSSFAWELSDVPDWLDVYGLSNASAGDIEFSILADLDKMPISGTDFSLSVKNGSDVFCTYKFKLPSSADLVISNVPETVSFLPDGKLDDEMGQPFLNALFTSAEGLQLFAATKIGDWYYIASPDSYFFNWITIEEVFGWDEGGDQIQDQRYRISMSANDSGDDRTAYLLAIPGSIKITNPEFDLFNDEGTEFKEEYKQYIVSTLTQTATREFLKIGESANCVFRPISQDGCAPYEKDVYEATAMYEIPVYTLVLTEATETYAAFDAQAYTNITFNNFDLSACSDEQIFATMEKDAWGNLNCAPIASKCGEDDQMMLIVFWNGEMPVALVYCVYSKGYVDAPADAPFSFAYPDWVKGATLKQCSAELLSAVNEQLSEMGTKIDAANAWELTYTTPDYSQVLLNVPCMPDEYPWIGWDENKWLSYEQAGENQLFIDMMSTEPAQDFYVFKENWMPKYVLVCTYAPEL